MTEAIAVRPRIGLAPLRRRDANDKVDLVVRATYLEPLQSAGAATVLLAAADASVRASLSPSGIPSHSQWLALSGLVSHVELARLQVFTMKELRETLEAESGSDLSTQQLKSELKAAMQHVLCELSGGALVADNR